MMNGVKKNKYKQSFGMYFTSISLIHRRNDSNLAFCPVNIICMYEYICILYIVCWTICSNCRRGGPVPQENCTVYTVRNLYSWQFLSWLISNTVFLKNKKRVKPQNIIWTLINKQINLFYSTDKVLKLINI